MDTRLLNGKRWLIVVAIALVLVLVLPVVMQISPVHAAAASATPTGMPTQATAQIWTDQADYSPEMTVTVSGSGFLPNSQVTVTVVRPDGSMNPPAWNVVADGSGGFTTTYQLDGITGTYTITATDETNTATTTFTDSQPSHFSTTTTLDPLPSTLVIGQSYPWSGLVSVDNPPPPAVPDGGNVQFQIRTGGCGTDGFDTLNINNVKVSADTGSGSGGSGSGTFSGTFTLQNPPITPGAYGFRAHFPSYNPNFDPYKSATFDESASACQSVTVTTNMAVDLTVSKTATASFTRTFTWSISKSVDKTEIDIASGGTATFGYTVSVTHDSGTDSDWEVAGTITVTNPNDWESITTDVADAVDNGGTCLVTGGTNVVVSASGSVVLPYTCTYASAPSASSGTNTATATWDNTLFSTPSGSATGTASFAFTTPTTIVDGSVSVSDTLGGALGTASYTDPSPTMFTYSHDFTGDTGGTCTTHDNTATFTTNTSGATGSANKEVKVCVGEDLTASKTATATFTRTYQWTISKSVDKTLVEQIGGTATFNYVVTAKETGFTDSGWQVTGTITVHNPNDWESITLTGVTDLVDNGGTCAVSGSTTQSIAPLGDSSGLTYTCTYASAPNPSSGTNTATATWDKTAYFTLDGSALGTATFAFTTPTTTISKVVTVSDTFNSVTSTLGTVTATDSQPFVSQTYTYSHTVNVPQFNCVFYPNTATIVETGQTASQKVEVCGPAKTGALTMGFWQNKNGQSIITGGSSTGSVCNLGTWLRLYAPFQDLSATATCGQVGTYVYNVIKAATAAGSSMNPMLKAQMLATALDVYFSDPALGGNKINAPAPIGGVKIDLTKICKMIDASGGTATCSGTYEDTSSAFTGSSLTVSQILIDAASHSNVGGSNWYGNVKATQQLAKDTFDAINNQLAFSP